MKKKHSNLQGRKEKYKPIYQLGQLLRSADIKSFFSKGETTNYSYKIYAFTEVINNTTPSRRFNCLSKIYYENILRSTKITLERNNQGIK